MLSCPTKEFRSTSIQKAKMNKFQKIQEQNVLLAKFFGLFQQDRGPRSNPWYYFTGCSYTIYCDEKALRYESSFDRLIPVYKKLMSAIDALSYQRLLVDQEKSMARNKGYYYTRYRDLQDALLTMSVENMHQVAADNVEYFFKQYVDLPWENKKNLDRYLPIIHLSRLKEEDKEHEWKVGDVMADGDGIHYLVVDMEYKTGLDFSL